MLVKPQNLVAILHEDEHLLVVAKPAGVDVGGLEKQTVAGLIELLAELRGKGEAFHPVNRLSRYESGVLLLGKSALAAAQLRLELKNGRFSQEYLGVVAGKLSKGRLVLGAPAEVEARPKRGKRKSPPTKRKKPEVRPAIVAGEAPTELLRVEVGEKRSLVRCVTQISTTHALRAQLRSGGLRLLGDPLHDRSRRPGAHYETCLHLTQARIVPPNSGKPLIFKSAPPAAFSSAVHGERNVERALQASLVRRMNLLADQTNDAIRLLNGSVEDVPGLVVEKLGPVLVMQTHDPPAWLDPMLKDLGRWFSGRFDVQSVYLKRFVKNRQGGEGDLDDYHRSERPFLGRPSPPQVEIHENGLRFAIRPYDGYSVGLFLDQRDNRLRVRELSNGKRVLNLFAYTCGFSVAAAAGGAEQTVSVDVAVKNLEWGKLNFGLNGLSLDQHLFLRSDAGEALTRLKRQNKLFDLIILDPPSFAHGRKSQKDFSVLEDMASLVGAATDVLAPEGILLVSTNHRKMTVRGLLERVRRGAPRGRVEILSMPPLPADFAMDQDYAKTVLAQVNDGSSPPDAAA